MGSNRSRSRACRPPRRGFTIVELMVVVLIISVLVSILIPVISKARERARAADTANFISQLQAAIESYQQEYRAYPGIMPDDFVRDPGMRATGSGSMSVGAITSAGYDTNWDPTKITGAENLVLSLLGGLKIGTTTPPIQYDPTQVGLGPMNLNAVNPARHAPFIDAVSLSWRDGGNGKTGRFGDAVGFADDTIIPEFVDKFSSPMPILYLRAKRGVQPLPVAQTPTVTVNSVVTYCNDPFANPRVGSYDVNQVIAYTGAYTGGETNLVLDTSSPPGDSSRSIGEGKRAPTYMQTASQQVSLSQQNWYHGLQTVDPKAALNQGKATGSTPNYKYPLDAYPYLQNPGMPGNARSKDSYILISAGIDRIYGTNDDICSFGSVQE